MLSPEGRVAMDRSYSSGGSEGSKGSASQKKRSPMSLEKTLSPRPVYSSATMAKWSQDIIMHNDKIDILRQMSQTFNNEKPSVDSEETEEEDTSCSGSNSGLVTKAKCPVKVENIQNKTLKTLNSTKLEKEPSASYMLMPEKPSLKSPSKLPLVQLSPSLNKDHQKDLDNPLHEDKNQEASKKAASRSDKVKTVFKQREEQDLKKVKATKKEVVKELNEREGSKQAKLQDKSTEKVEITRGSPQSHKVEVLEYPEIKDRSKTDDVKSGENLESNKDHTKQHLEPLALSKVERRQGKTNIPLQSDNCKPSNDSDAADANVKNDNDSLLQNVNNERCAKEDDFLLQIVDKKNYVKKDEGALQQSVDKRESSTGNLSTESSLKKSGDRENNFSENKEKMKIDDKNKSEKYKESSELLEKKDSSREREEKTDAKKQSSLQLVDSPSEDEPPFLGFPDKVPKVYRVSSYLAFPEENIKVESRIGPKGEVMDVLDGFTFMSFDTQEEMMIYAKMEFIRKLRMLRRKKRRANNLTRVKRHVQKASPSSLGDFVEKSRESRGLLVSSDSAEQSSAFARYGRFCLFYSYTEIHFKFCCLYYIDI